MYGTCTNIKGKNMSTNCNVAIQSADGSVRSVYGHWDGGLWDGGVADVLIEHYTTEEQVNALIDLGSFSVLTSSIDASVFHCRDHGEFLVISDKIDSQEYDYLFIDGKWMLSCEETNEEFVLLDQPTRIELEFIEDDEWNYS
jgi:hypothetical protein